MIDFLYNSNYGGVSNSSGNGNGLVLWVGLWLFSVGVGGVISNRRSVLLVLVSIELALLGGNIVYLGYSVGSGDLSGQIMGLYILSVAAAESAIGLAILVVFYRVRGSVSEFSSGLLQG